MSDNMLREKIAEIIGPHLGMIPRSDAGLIADRILALPEIAEALNIEIPDEWPGDTAYARGWNDCRRHAKSIIVRSASPPA